MNITDPTLGLNNQALAVLHALAGIPLKEGLRTSTAAWYNGREQGFVLSVSRGFANPALQIVVAECRNSDDIVIQKWIADSHINPPTVADFPEQAYRMQHRCSYMAVGAAVSYIQDAIENFSHD